MTTPASPLPLQGLKVLELSHNVMGPTAGLILADLGAQVVKIEKTPDGDDTRRLKGFGIGFFPYFNRNKSSLALDLKAEGGKAVFRRLIQWADVLVENFAPGTLERLGFGWEAARDLNPRLIYCSLKGFMPGPYERRQALDEVVQMMGGLAYMTGPRERPLRAGASVVDIMGGTYGVVGILAALLERRETGRGKLVQATLFESTVFLVGQHLAVAALTGAPAPPMPERGRTWSVYDLFATADDDQVFLGVTSERHWERFCQKFGWNDLLADPRLTSNAKRIEARDWLLPELGRRLGRLTKAEILGLAEAAEIPFAPVARPEDLAEDVQVKEAHALTETRLPEGRTVKLPKLPLRLDGESFEARQGPPDLGQGGLGFLKEAGFTEAEIETLANQGVIVGG